MRNIKFRCWNTITKRWVYPVLDVSNPFSYAGCEFSQYTGEEDDNGKEIFEGDVITANDSRYVVYWDENGRACAWEVAQVKGDEVDDYPLWLLSQLINPEYTNVVVGNIYENPELRPC